MMQNKRKKRLYLAAGVSVLALGAATLGGVAIKQRMDTLSSQTALKEIAGLFGQQVDAYRRRDSGLVGSYLSARHAALTNDSRNASHYFDQALKHHPDNMAIHQQALQSYLASGQYPRAKTIAEGMVDSAERNSQLALILLMTEALHNGNYDQTYGWLEEMPPYGLMSIISPLMREWLAVVAPDALPEKMAKQKANAEASKGFFRPIYFYQKALMADQKNDVKASQAHFQKALGESQINASPRVLLSYLDFKLRHGGVEAFQAEYQRLSDALVKERGARAPLKLALGAEEEILKFLQARKGVPLVGTVQQSVAEIFFMVAQILHADDMAMETQLYLRLALRLNGDLQDASLLLSDAMEDKEKARKVEAIYRAVPKGSPAYLYRTANLALARSLHGREQVEEGIAVLRNLALSYPDDALIYLELADSYRQQKKLPEAIENYTKVLSLREAGDSENWVVFYARGASHEQNGDWGKAEADFKAALELSPEQPEVLNYLAYGWLERNKNLKRAKEMLEQAVAEQPENAHIVDSMGWAFFMLGEYHDAVDYLEQATDLAPSDPTINDHLGDALWHVGRKNEARFQWEKALQFKPEKLQDIERIQQKLELGYQQPDEALQKGVEQTSVVLKSDVSKPAVSVPAVPMTPKSQ